MYVMTQTKTSLLNPVSSDLTKNWPILLYNSIVAVYVAVVII